MAKCLLIHSKKAHHDPALVHCNHIPTIIKERPPFVFEQIQLTSRLRGLRTTYSFNETKSIG